MILVLDLAAAAGVGKACAITVSETVKMPSAGFIYYLCSQIPEIMKKYMKNKFA